MQNSTTLEGNLAVLTKLSLILSHDLAILFIGIYLNDL